MYHLWCWITSNAEAITAIAAFVAALATVAYLVATILIFLQTKKSADAAEKSAQAADKSSDAAQKSVALMRQQFEEQAGLGKFIVESTIDRAIDAINAIFQPEPFRNFNVPESSSRLELLIEQQAEPAINHAARINAEVAKHLSSALDSLRAGLGYLSVLTERNLPPGHSAHNLSVIRTEQSLKRALAEFLLAKQAFTAGPTPRH